MLRVSEDGNHQREGYLSDYKQLRESLIVLQNAADQVFDTISERTANESAKLVDLSNRIQNAKVKLDRISHSKNAIKMKSSSRYPSTSDGEEDFKSLFGHKDGTSDVDFPVAEVLVNGGLKREFGVDGTFELFRFFSETTGEFVQMEVQAEAASKVTHSNRDAILENLLGTPNYTYSSFLKEDDIGADSLPKQKHQDLPPPPPSLLGNSQALPSKEGLSLRPRVRSSKLQNNIPDLPSVSRIVHSGFLNGVLQPVVHFEKKFYLLSIPTERFRKKNKENIKILNKSSMLEQRLKAGYCCLRNFKRMTRMRLCIMDCNPTLCR